MHLWFISLVHQPNKQNHQRMSRQIKYMLCNESCMPWHSERCFFKIKSADSEEKSLFQSFSAFRTAWMQGKAANCHMLLKMIRETKVSSDWFGCVLIISFFLNYLTTEKFLIGPLFVFGGWIALRCGKGVVSPIILNRRIWRRNYFARCAMMLRSKLMSGWIQLVRGSGRGRGRLFFLMREYATQMQTPIEIPDVQAARNREEAPVNQPSFRSRASYTHAITFQNERWNGSGL